MGRNREGKRPAAHPSGIMFGPPSARPIGYLVIDVQFPGGGLSG